MLPDFVVFLKTDQKILFNKLAALSVSGPTKVHKHFKIKNPIEISSNRAKTKEKQNLHGFADK